MSRFEKRMINKRKRLARKGNPMFRNAIKKQYEQALSIISFTAVDQLNDIAISEEPIKKAFENYYSSASEIGMMYREELLPGASMDDIFKRAFEKRLADYAKIEAGKRITDITNYSKELIEKVVKDATQTAVAEGYGVEKAKRLIIDAVKENYKQITPQRARMIAQTEMTTASNRAAIAGVESTGLKTRKFWTTSGLPNVRQSHLDCERYSIEKNGLNDGELFPNGLEFPCDPRGEASEVVNCHCGLLFEVVR